MTGGGEVSEQISIVQTRQALEVILGLVPVLNGDELIDLMEFFQKVILRLDEEEAYKIEEKRTQK